MRPSVKVIYEDSDLRVIEKPAGVPSPLDADGACHRLDTATSGLVVIAKNQETYRKMREMFSKNKIEKEYVALATGIVAKPGKIDWPIGPDPRSSKRVKVYRNLKEARRAKAQEAVTYYQPIGRVLSPGIPLSCVQKERSQGDDRPPPARTWLRIQIKTGRRHQIRAHLASIGHPIVGDTLYKGPPSDRLYLHASSVEFNHPRTGRPIQVKSQPTFGL